MTIVSNKDFAINHDRYFDLAIDEDVAVKRGDYTFRIVCNFSTAQKEQKILKPDDKLRSAISGEEFRKSALEIVEKVHHKFYGNERKIYPGNA